MSKQIDNRPYRVAYGDRYDHVRGLHAARARLAEYIGGGVTVDEIASNKRRIAGTIERVTAADARCAGI